MTRKMLRRGLPVSIVLLPALLAAQTITPAPPFSGAELAAPPTQGWITNGGNVYNQRYSPLARIHRNNVADLKALWRTSMGSGDAFKNSGQAQILAFDGVLYVANGVFALDVDPERGGELYAQACVACHGPKGAVAGEGRNTMPAFGGAYTSADLPDVASYILERLAPSR